MSDYLSHLAARSLNSGEVIRPRLASRFEPPHTAGGSVSRHSVETADQTSTALHATLPTERTALDVPSPTLTRRRQPDHALALTAQTLETRPAQPPRQPASSSSLPQVQVRAAQPVSVQLVQPVNLPAETYAAPSPTTAVVRLRPAPAFGSAPVAAAPLQEKLQVTPTISVTIGRIEVRAVAPPAPPPKRNSAPMPKLSLDDYLKQRESRR